MVKFSIGTVIRPVTHVDDTAVKKQSMSGNVFVEAIGSESKKVPIPIAKLMENKIVLLGEKKIVFFKVIYMPLKGYYFIISIVDSTSSMNMITRVLKYRSIYFCIVSPHKYITIPTR